MNATEPIVYVVDDDQAMREALGSLIRSFGMRPEIFESAADFSQATRSDSLSCLVLDVRMEGMSGLELQRQLAALGERIPIVFISGHGDIPMTVRAIKAGAVEFLPKPFSDQSLLDAITVALSADASLRQERMDTSQIEERYASLSSREQEVMSGVVRGLRNKQVAFELGISEETVKVHRHRLMMKMNAKTLPELVRMAGRLRKLQE